jgi:hypothetical protein
MTEEAARPLGGYIQRLRGEKEWGVRELQRLKGWGLRVSLVTGGVSA